MKVLHTIRDTPSNPSGLCDLTPADVSFVAYPGSTSSGEVHLFDAATLQGLSVIPAHNGPLNALKFNAEGTLLASASEKGTVIRVFAIPGGQRLFEFRRGIKRHIGYRLSVERRPTICHLKYPIFCNKNELLRRHVYPELAAKAFAQ
ncbi:WD repeat domain phosphoinositide-interacting protein 2 (WIPI-2) [Trichinella spiralis]|uniref:WD repeat domain phosphoinositide-interacting protein 2 (WIPI-2) n=1 Tax=Trichinella spiralis TaxID=6334 RepID=UPI0001EFC79C|nr:WD repeat domain phosphoinositide-interacting protein 2 (WIPI-2) [Trichinella spiralis]